MKQERLLQEAISEITSLRIQNEVMAARLDMFDKCMLLFHTEPAFPRKGMSEDIAWKLQQQIDRPEKTFTGDDLARLQTEVHKVTGDGKVMQLFNELLGVCAK